MLKGKGLVQETDEGTAPQGMQGKVTHWYHDLAQVSGGLTLRLAKKTLVVREVAIWADTLHNVANQMQQWMDDV